MGTDTSRRYRLPRWGGVILWVTVGPLFHGVLPWALSRLGPHVGWNTAGPVPAQWFGLALVAAGFLLIAWALTQHYVFTPEGWESIRPKVLIVSGPYRYSRNPMYLGAFAIWLGWIWFYESPTVAAGFLLFFVYIISFQVPFEERQMASIFGSAYREYQRMVSRWVGRTERNRQANSR